MNFRDLINKASRFFRFFEEWLLIALVVFLTGFALLQVVLRNFFSTGITWGDTLLRHMTLWIGFLGASRATAENKHIRIELIPMALSQKGTAVLSAVRGFFLIFISAALLYASLIFLRDERAAGSIAFNGIPYWQLEIIFPLTFLVMTLRFVRLFARDLRELYKKEER